MVVISSGKIEVKNKKWFRNITSPYIQTMSKNDIDDEPVIDEETDDDDETDDDGEVKDDDYDEEAKVVDDDEETDEENDNDNDNDNGNGENDDEEKDVKPAMLTRDIFGDDDDDNDEDDELNENYMQKLESDVKHNIISEHHPELNAHNIEEVETMCAIIRDTKGQIIDPFHRTVPFVTRYEKARVLGERAKQINSGAKPFIEIDRTMIDGYLIALKEFEEKKIPFIIRRPLPSGASEYWRLADLEIIA
jgi:DNA-directed RNA polymerase subunit K/omega